MEDLQERITAAAQRTWQAIGGDVLRSANVNSVSREEVVECVMDYIDAYGNDVDAVVEFKTLTYEEREKMLLKAFPFGRYGW